MLTITKPLTGASVKREPRNKQKKDYNVVVIQDSQDIQQKKRQRFALSSSIFPMTDECLFRMHFQGKRGPLMFLKSLKSLLDHGSFTVVGAGQEDTLFPKNAGLFSHGLLTDQSTLNNPQMGQEIDPDMMPSIPMKSSVDDRHINNDHGSGSGNGTTTGSRPGTFQGLYMECIDKTETVMIIAKLAADSVTSCTTQENIDQYKFKIHIQSLLQQIGHIPQTYPFSIGLNPTESELTLRAYVPNNVCHFVKTTMKIAMEETTPKRLLQNLEYDHVSEFSLCDFKATMKNAQDIGASKVSIRIFETMNPIEGQPRPLFVLFRIKSDPTVKREITVEKCYVSMMQSNTTSTHGTLYRNVPPEEAATYTEKIRQSDVTEVYNQSFKTQILHAATKDIPHQLILWLSKDKPLIIVSPLGDQSHIAYVISPDSTNDVFPNTCFQQ
jgi:hypothetical protein